MTKEIRDNIWRLVKTKYWEICYKMYEICTCRKCMENKKKN